MAARQIWLIPLSMTSGPVEVLERELGMGGLVAPPNTSTPWQPTVQMPNENKSCLLGT
jgi:hypothetical protein